MSRNTAPDHCPLCSAPMTSYSDASEDAYEAWEYGCKLEIFLMENGVLHANTDCSVATNEAIKRLTQE